LGGLFPNVGLFFKVDVAERVILEDVRGAGDVEWEDV
jgi:hypothetical protein